MMQGERVEASIIAALDRIYSHVDDWDVVVIIRGGGATSDLSNFDSYLLAANCAQFPLPIITGIGHERDDTAIDAVAHTRVKTPTAAAEYLVARMHEAGQALDDYASRIRHNTLLTLEREHQRIERLAITLPALLKGYCLREERRADGLRHRIESATRSHLLKEKYRTEQWAERIPRLVRAHLEKETHRLQLLQQRIETLSPERLLARGYSITLKDGHAVTDATRLASGDRLTTRLAKGEVHSVVE